MPTLSDIKTTVGTFKVDYDMGCKEQHDCPGEPPSIHRAMSTIEYRTSSRVRVCRLCGTDIVGHTFAIVMLDIHVPPKKVDLHFHEGCFFRAVTHASDARNIRKYKGK